MATFIWGPAAFGVQRAGVSVTVLSDTSSFVATPTSIKFVGDETGYLVFTGTGLKHTLSHAGPRRVDDITEGRVTGMKIVVQGDLVLSGTDIKLLASRVGDAFFARDDEALFDILFSGNDTVIGTKDIDELKGRDGNDTLKGGLGRDHLTGGKGADKLYGGLGRDDFIFHSTQDSTFSPRGQDTIFDFSRFQGDRIVLNHIDADTTKRGSQNFDFIYGNEFSGKAGELRYKIKGSDTYVYGDTDGDRKVDFAIHIDKAISLQYADFLLFDL